MWYFRRNCRERFKPFTSSHMPEKLSSIYMTRFIFPILVCLCMASNGLSQPFGNEWIDFSKGYFKFGLREQRFFRIPLSTLSANGLGTVPVEHFQLWRDGEEVPLFTSVPSGVLPANGYIEFFGKPNTGKNETDLYSETWHHTQPERSFFTDTAWYFLTVNPAGNNKRFETVENLVNSTTLPADSFYMHTLNGLAGNNNYNWGYARNIGANFFRSSIWDFGESYSSSYFNSTRFVQFNLTGLRSFMNGPSMQLYYGVAGATTASRKVLVRMNDQPFDSVYAPFYDLKIRNISNIAISNIIGDAINFKFYSDNDVWYEGVSVNGFRLKYPRQFFHNQQNPIKINLAANNHGNHIRLAGLPNSGVQPVLYDITNLKRYIGILKQDSSLFELRPSQNERQVIIGTQLAQHLRTISALRPVQFKNYALTENQANYLIISNKILRHGAEDMVDAYRAYRSSNIGGGYNAATFDIDELGDQFCFGNRKNPLAIRRFVKFAIEKFQQKPKMVFIIGKGSIYLSAASGGGVVAELLNAVPTWGHPGSDNLLVAASNSNPVPLVPIGRIGAVSPEEIKIYLDKVKEYESLQFKKPLLPSDNSWRKKVLQLIGANIDNSSEDIFELPLIRNFFTTYASQLEAPKVGAKSYIFQSIENPTFSDDMQFIERSISEGVGLVKYFGHSSTTSLDFNLGSPDQFNNLPGRYPIYYANGCRAGSIFEYNGQRLTAREVTISDNFTFSPSRGSIAFISSSDIAEYSPQNLISRNWIAAYSNDKFGMTIGEIHQEALKQTFSLAVPAQPAYFSNKITIEQMVLHGDPAIVPFPHQKPDFAVESVFMEPKPKRALTELDSLWVKVHFFNLGEAATDSVTVLIEREMPDGTNQLVYKEKLDSVFNKDSIIITLPIKGLFEEGNGSLVARIDPANEFPETDEDNNVAVLPLLLERNHITPVWPYNYSILNHPGIVFRASTTDPIEIQKTYTFQFDTTIHFNSPLLTMVDTGSTGGVIECSPTLPYSPNVVYYWRAFLKEGSPTPDTPVFSFLYQPGSETGFNQSHFFQHKNSDADGIYFNEERIWTYNDKLNNLYCNHGIYPSSGTEDTHFSLTVNGLKIARSACVGSSIIFNVFDSLTFAPWRNAGGDFGSGGVCGPGREFNFEFRYYNHVNRKTIMDFLDQIPKGTYVAARLVVDPPYDSLRVNYWMRDTAIYGSGNSLYHYLKNQGFSELDSLNRTRTFFFVFRKDDSASFKPFYKFSRGTIDRVHASVYAPTADSTATIISPWLGPSLEWKQAHWGITNSAGTSANMTLELWGRNNSNDTIRLRQWTNWNGEINIADIPAGEYPLLQFRLTLNNQFGTPTPQLNYWRLYYTPLPDGAWSAKDYFVLKKDKLKPFGDTLSFKLAFKNISSNFLDSVDVKVTLIENSGDYRQTYHEKIKSLTPGDTTIFTFEKRLELAEGDYTIQIEANETGDPAEQNYFNNRALLRFVVDGSVLPHYLLSFDAIKQESVSLIKWTSAGDDVLKGYSVEHSIPGGRFITIQEKPINAGLPGIEQSYEIVHNNPSPGWNLYRLRLNQKDGTNKYSEVKRLYFDLEQMVNVFPNPFNRYFNLQPLDANKDWQLQIFDASGRLILSEKGLGTKQIEMANAASGTYFAQWTSGKQKIVFKILKL